MNYRILPWVGLMVLLSLSLKGQDHHGIYPDSLKSFVLKIEPLSFLSNQITAGFEIPLAGSKFIDINIGYSGLGFSGAQKTNGFLFKGGVKFPKKFQTPYSMV